MPIVIFILFAAALIGGLSAKFLNEKAISIRYPLIFAGSFIFSITIIHILPEVFGLSTNPMKAGLYVLLGFFFQQFLEYFTSGIEHGHSHSHDHISGVSRYGLLIALIIHSLLEGALLTHDSPFHQEHGAYSLLIGIILHKMPAAFALVTTLRAGHSHKSVWVFLLLFSLASPAGMIASGYILSIAEQSLLILFAFVSGGFLHISTTIFVETSPNHRFGIQKLLVSLLGAAIAVSTEYLL